ncbi:MAG: hypothetical protein E6H52_17635 [Betaproteobacteria bacterium]|jgi:hypothetical protein|nr:MAG: hypothetical protein E6H52_17635 [Betaproteobacteria bacterium]
MTIASCRWISKIALASMIVAAAGANATPVVYTLRTVADGKLGSYVFAEALVTIRMKADTGTVQKQASSNGGFLYTNSVGPVTVSVTDASGSTKVATFAPGEVYVRYDSGMGIAGFASALSPSYPVALDCDDVAYPSNATYVQDCLQSDWTGNSNEFNGTLSAQAGQSGIAGFGEVLSPELASLPQSLSQSTLLTGQAHSCATTYTVGPTLGFFITGDLSVCAGPASRGLSTDHGGFFLQDQVGGSITPFNPIGWGGWGAANTGSLQVEVMTEE